MDDVPVLDWFTRGVRGVRESIYIRANILTLKKIGGGTTTTNNSRLLIPVYTR